MKDTWIIKLKNRIRKWLGIGNMFMGVDVGIADDTTCVIVSKLNKGRVEIIDMHIGTASELKEFIQLCKSRYGILNRDIVMDTPIGYPRDLIL